MTTDLSAAALLSAAEAFLARGDAIQYDQRSMDRVVQITPRRDKLAPPEAATVQHMLFLDCSFFVNAVYHTAFGRVLDADLTWHMAQMIQPCVFRWQFSHAETPEERRRISRETAALLRCVGDLVQEPRKVGAGDLVQPVGVAYRYALAYAADIGRGEFPRGESRRGKR